MSQNTSRVFEKLDSHLQRLDEAPANSSSFFESASRKERYESVLMYAYRKCQAVHYHLANVNRHVQFDGAGLGVACDLPPPPPGINVTRATASISTSADHYIYELSAFFEALKSCLDFLATALSDYVKGAKFDSIGQLMKSVEKGRTGPPYNLIATHLIWLKQVREYRHHLVHRMVLTASMSHHAHLRGDHQRAASCPVCVPSTTPRYVPDTRRHRVLTDNHDFIHSTESWCTITKTDGSSELLDWSLEIHAPPGHEEISAFMSDHLERLEAFFCLTIDALDAYGFQHVDGRH